ncbi:MAG: hypothetical protein CTY22_07185 [Methylomonas sp.]|nr:MAG: hypothetical protein CTY23_11195 [Methylomonas sp.]PPD25812.1 MAG: hypothetical protein CTY22_07185 [Methylomonas sp.]PPD37271.1 MAG: hypothetical protein CTY21_07185 [Methylomonas sp.]PPD39037.1 MAG: hypothetical protein CTY17_08525 [Methylomonas sp.]PPD52983.1 MAG: hypothetical protein CTY11_07515 [Methylomonas sp.]
MGQRSDVEVFGVDGLVFGVDSLAFGLKIAVFAMQKRLLTGNGWASCAACVINARINVATSVLAEAARFN